MNGQARLLLRACRLACKDYWHESLLSLCAVLGLAAIVTPLLILYGVKFGVVETLNQRLLQDPLNLEISPVSSGRYTAAWLEQLRQRPDVAFVLPRTRSIAATIFLRPAGDTQARDLPVSLEPTASGDPLLLRYGITPPAATQPVAASPLAPAVPDTSGNSPEGQLAPIDMVLSATAAGKTGLHTGSLALGLAERRLAGVVQQAEVLLRVAAVLPLAAQARDVALVPLFLLEAVEDFRDGRAVPELERWPERPQWTGEARPDEARLYPGFRLYANALDRVEGLRTAFAAQGIEVHTRAAEIAQVVSLSRALDSIFALICAAAAAGFLASTGSSALAAVARKERTLGLLRLTGFGTLPLLLFPLAQALLTAVLGTALAALAYGLAALLINHLFAAHLDSMEQICRLEILHFALALGLTTLLSLLAALAPALRAARVEPSEVIRDV